LKGFNQQEISSKLGELIDANENGALKAEQVKSNIDSELLAKADRIETLEKIRLELEDKAQSATDPFVKAPFVIRSTREGARETDADRSNKWFEDATRQTSSKRFPVVQMSVR
jgi:hypothetical protein